MTYTLEQRATAYYNKKMITPLTYMMKGRSLFLKTTPVPAGKFVMEFDRITDMGDALITYDIPDVTIERDEIGTTADSVRLVVISKGWQVGYSKWNSFASEGVDLPTENMNSALRVIGATESNMLIQSWKPDGTHARVNGLYAAAGNSYSTSSDFGTAGNAVTAVGGALDLMRADKISGVNYNLTLNTTQYNQLQTSTFTNGDMEWDRVLKLLNQEGGPAPGRITWSPYITADTGLMSPADPDGQYMELLVGQNIRNILGRDSKMAEISPLYGTTYEVLAPRVIHSEAICTLTSI